MMDNQQNKPDKRVIVALDVANYDAAMRLADQLPVECCRVKVGKSLFTRCGPKIIHALHENGHEVFLDLKFHDIPNTVAEAVDAAAELGVWMVNVHAQGGTAMLAAAKQALDGKASPPLLIAVTVLTSMDAKAWQALGHSRDIAAQVTFLTALAAEAGLDGVVCSALEAERIRTMYGNALMTVTPGIRPQWSSSDDQARIVTPRQARKLGSDYLVIGRPISKADDPRAALMRVLAELNPHRETEHEKL